MEEALTIVVVDDEQPILNIFKSYLEMTGGHTVLATEKGSEALQMIADQKVDCCFLDLNMPDMDGIELSRRIHQHDNTIPMAVMTGYPTMDNAISTLKNGVVDFLTKPVELAQISITIKRMMRERALLTNNILLKEEAKKNDRLMAINEELQQKINEVEIMNSIMQELDQVSTSSDLFHVLVNLSGRVTACDEAHCAVFYSEMGEYQTISSFYRNSTRGEEQSRHLHDDVIKKVARDGMPVISNSGNGGDHILAIPLKIRNKIFGLLKLSSGNKRGRFKEKDVYFINFIAEKASFLIENLALYENIFDNLFATLYAFVETIEARDTYTKQHSARVSHYAKTIAEAAGCSSEDMEKLHVAGYLHDIGKIGIPDNILLKNGALTTNEFETIKSHPVIASNILGYFNMWTDEKTIIRHHHEKFDGTGYPDALKGEDVPYLSRILSVADVYDALTSDRSYRKKMPEAKALSIIADGSGSQFDPDVVAKFLELHAQGRIIFTQDLKTPTDITPKAA